MNCFASELLKHDNVEISALCDPNDVRMKAAAEKLKGEQCCYSEVETMLAKESLDAVVITSPDYCHENNAVAALKSGADVLIDKPLATTVAACRNIINTAKETGKNVIMGFNLRHTPTLKRLKSIIERGDLGRIFLIENREFYDGGRTYMARWNRKYDYSGGLWIHKGSHDFDVFNWLIDDFLKVIKGDLKVNATIDHGLISTAIGQAAEIAWREERVVFMDELLK